MESINSHPGIGCRSFLHARPRQDLHGRWNYIGVPADFKVGSIQRVDLKTGRFETLYRRINGNTLRGSNDLVFDEFGCIGFTDTGKHYAKTDDRGGLYWAKTDGTVGAPQPNGETVVEPTMSVDDVGEAVTYMAGLPLNAKVQFMTLLATTMPFIGRG